MRTAPVSIDQNGSIWISENNQLVLVFIGEIPTLYSHKLNTKFRNDYEWRPIGRGWLGLENTIQVLQNTTFPNPKPSILLKDSRELLF